MLSALTIVKRNENETIEEFNEIVQILYIDIKLLEAAILIYYLDAFDGELNFQLRQRDPQKLKFTQESTKVLLEPTLQGMSQEP
jgi:hypothetical protein